MNLKNVKIGINVKTNSKLESPTGMILGDKFKLNRKANTEGTVVGFFPGHGGDVWAVRHADGSEAAYCFTEFEST